MLSVVDKVLFFTRVPLTARCTTDALARLAAVAVEREAAAGELLFRAGDEPEALYVVIAGAVALETQAGGSTLARVGDALLGLEVLGDAPLSATARAVTAARLFRVARADLEALLDEDGELARALFAAVVQAARAQWDAIVTG